MAASALHQVVGRGETAAENLRGDRQDRQDRQEEQPVGQAALLAPGCPQSVLANRKCGRTARRRRSFVRNLCNKPSSESPTRLFERSRAHSLNAPRIVVYMVGVDFNRRSVSDKGAYFSLLASHRTDC